MQRLMQEGSRLGPVSLAINDVVQENRGQHEKRSPFGDGEELCIVKALELLPEHPRRPGEHRIQVCDPFEGLIAWAAQVGSSQTSHSTEALGQSTAKGLVTRVHLGKQPGGARVRWEFQGTHVTCTLDYVQELKTAPAYGAAADATPRGS